MPRKISTEAAPAPFSRYAQAVRTRRDCELVFISGQVGVDPQGKLAETDRGQHEQVWRNLMAILASEDLGPENVVEVTAYVTSPTGIPVYREVRDQYMQGVEAASTLLVISGLAHPDWKVEISLIAEAPAS